MPVSVLDISNATQIEAGYQHSCALISGGTVKCWGDNQYGELGDNSNTTRGTPVSVSGLSGVSEVTAGSDFTCARLADGTAKCWGIASYGRLGNNNDTTNKITNSSNQNISYSPV